jgi:hypothetical protein
MNPSCEYIHPYGKHKGEQCIRTPLIDLRYCGTHKEYQNGACKGIIQQGKAKGSSCFRPATQGEFCGKHQPKEPARTKQHKQLKQTAIKQCKAVLLSGTKKQCRYSVKGTGEYCGKHSELFTMRDYAKAISQRLCGDGLRCKNFIEDPAKSHCETCLAKYREHDNALYREKAMNETRCLECGKYNVEFAYSKGGKQTRYCHVCYTKLRSVEDSRTRFSATRAVSNPVAYYESYKHDAERRDYNFDLTYSEFMSVISKPCTYCSHYIETEYNGVDRIDSSGDYTITNCLPACKLCNYFKSNHTTEEFIQHCLAIHGFQTSNQVSADRIKWTTPNNIPYNTYKRNTVRGRGLVFEITEAEYTILKHGSCYLCGSPSTEESLNGIDRVDSNKGYVTNNVRSCCPPCNMMKLDHGLEEFVQHCGKITNHSNANLGSPPTRVIQL